MSTIYVGIDIGKHKHEANIVDATGNQLVKCLVLNNSQQSVQKVLDRVVHWLQTKLFMVL